MFRSVRTVLTFIGVITALICYALVVFYPAFPRSIIGWIGLVFVGVPLLFFVEWLGEKTLGSKFFTRLPSVARIALGVPGVVLLMAAVVWLVANARTLINS